MSAEHGADVVVVGAGISGLAAAMELARRGASVIVVDKEETVGAEASGRAQGSLRLQGRHPAEYPLARAAMDLWRAVEQESSAEVQFNGNAYLAQSQNEIAALASTVADSQRLGLTSAVLVDAHRARATIPAARGPFLAAMISSADGQADPFKATQHYAQCARHAGADIRLGTRALGLDVDSSRVAGVRTDSGYVRTGTVVLAAGVWTPHLASTAGVPIPIMPVALTTGETSPLDRILGPTVRSSGFSAKQRPDGRVVIDAGMNCSVTHRMSLADTRYARLWLPRLARYRRSVHLSVDAARILAELRYGNRHDPRSVPVGETGLRPNYRELDRALNAMAHVFPAVRQARIARAWTGMIDMSPDGLPFIGSCNDVQRLVIACGFSGHGFTLGPVTGQIAARLALGERCDFDLTSFRIDRARDRRLAVPDRMM